MRFARFTRLFVALVVAAFLSIPVATAQSPSQAPQSPSQTPTTGKPQGENTRPGKAQVDINSASADELKTLPGIGDAYAKKIIDGRPYANKSQLKSKGIVPASTYDKISGQIVARHGSTAKQNPQ